MSTTNVTEADVIEAAYDQIRKRDGFTPATYFGISPTHRPLSDPGENVVMTCAIGGVEQAIWKLTGKHVSRMARHRVAQSDKALPRSLSGPQHVLYGKVMKRLNRITRELYSDLKDSEGEPQNPNNIEEITFVGTSLAAKRRVLKVLRAARAEVSQSS